MPRLTSQADLARVAAAALTATAAPSPASVAIVLADDAELATLNERHMGEAGPTDVLSFPMLELDRGRPREQPGGAGFRLPPRQRVHLGDIVISVERAIEQAEQGRGGQTGDLAWGPADELRLLVVHGVLHVCGWDHAVPADETAMRSLERRILGQH